jgi:hypothetical protein
MLSWESLRPDSLKVANNVIFYLPSNAARKNQKIRLPSYQAWFMQ